MEKISSDELAILNDARKEIELSQAALNCIVRSIAKKYNFNEGTKLMDNGDIIRAEVEAI